MLDITITDSFSVSMLPPIEKDGRVLVEFRPISIEPLRSCVNAKYGCVVSSIDSADTAKIISDLLGKEFPVYHFPVKLTWFERLIIGQYVKSELSGEAKMEFWEAKLVSYL